MYFGKKEIESVYLPDRTDFTVNLVPGISLNLHVEGQGVITSDYFQKLYNPKSYASYNEPSPVLAEMPESNRVEMQHHACPGYAFSHWEIKDAQGNWIEAKDTQGNLITGDLSVWMNWFQPGSLFHVPDGQVQYDVKAVFVETCVVKLKLCVEIEKGVSNGECFLFPPWVI